MKVCTLLLIVSVILNQAEFCELLVFKLVSPGSIQDKVNYHEVISVHKTHMRIRKSVDRASGKEKLSRDFSFHTFNRLVMLLSVLKLNIVTTHCLLLSFVNSEYNE